MKNHPVIPQLEGRVSKVGSTLKFLKLISQANNQNQEREKFGSAEEDRKGQTLIRWTAAFRAYAKELTQSQYGSSAQKRPSRVT